MVRAVILMFCVVLMAVPPTFAQGTGPAVPPGQSAIDENLESVPGAGGSTGARPRPKGGAPAGARSSLPAATRRALERDGADGAAAAALAERDAGSASSGKRGKRAAPADRTPRQGSASADAGTLPAITRTISGDRQGGGFGGWVPLVLAGILVVFAALGIRRRRGGSGGAPA